MGVRPSKLTESYSYTQSSSCTDTHPCNTFTESVRYHAKHLPSREAMVFVSTDGTREAVTFKELNAKSQEVARAYIRMGIKRNEVIAVNLRPCPDWLFLVFGAMFAGAVPIGLSFTYSDGSDIITMMKKLQTCSMLILEPGPMQENWNIISRLIDSVSSDGSVHGSRLHYVRYLVLHSNPESQADVFTMNDMLHNVPNEIVLPEITPTDIAMLFQTSGSTGVPKCAAHTHSVVGYINTLFKHEYFTPDDIYFCDRPFGWVGGFPFNILVGQTRVTKSGFSSEPEDNILFAIAVIKKEQCTVVGCLPNSLYDYYKHKDELQGMKVKSILTGGQPLGEDLAKCAGQLCEYFVAVYGSTEVIAASGFAVQTPSDYHEFSSGYTMKAVEVKIVDENKITVPVNTRGEIYIRHPYMFKEYFNDPEKTALVMTDDGWLRMDDLGRLNEDGVLYVEGRKSNMILSGGMNIAPEILEAILKTCPDIDTIVIVPVSDHVRYQVICACVIIKVGSCLTEEKIREFCETVHNDKPRLFTVLPEFYMIVDKFPETNTGKTSRRELTVMAENMFGSK